MARTKKVVATVNSEVALTKESNVFESLRAMAVAQVKETEKAVKEAEEKLKEAKKLQTEANIAINRLRTIKALSKRTENLPYTWNEDRQGGSSYQQYAWKEVSNYVTSAYEFTIVLTERTDLKKMKWEVSISGVKIYPAETLYHGSDYRDFNYINKKYVGEGETLKEKFASELEARRFVQRWQERLVNDHLLEIMEERHLCEMAKKLPKVQVGSVVEHPRMGIGTVRMHINNETWSVEFDIEGKTMSLRMSEEEFKLVK